MLPKFHRNFSVGFMFDGDLTSELSGRKNTLSVRGRFLVFYQTVRGFFSKRYFEVDADAERCNTCRLN